MKGDFTRDTFDPAKHFSRVLMQQGRVQLDADWNEQMAILLHYVRTLAKDLIGEHGGPDTGFAIGVGTALKMDFAIWQGRYYVDGILCENEQVDLTYKSQRGYPFPDSEALQNNKNHLVYLDVWERHVTAFEDNTIREVALGEADTTTRAQVVWQVKTTTKMPNKTDIVGDEKTDWAKWMQDTGWTQWVSQWQPENRGRLKALVKPLDGATDPCITPPQSGFRGAENQLYRVEIHSGGTSAQATFKWSRDNGSVVTEWKDKQGNDLIVGNGRGFAAGQWVELTDDIRELHGDRGIMVKLAKVEGETLTMDPNSTKESTDRMPTFVNPKVRRWDQRSPTNVALQRDDNAIPVQEGTTIDLEDGIQIEFEPPGAGASANHYRTGDYWLIPARTATGDVEWPGPVGQPEAQPPHGIDHHYAPLAMVGVGATDVGWMSGFRQTI